MASRKKLSDGTITTALAAIEAQLADGGPPRSLDDSQALFDARRELTALNAPKPAKPAARRQTQTNRPQAVNAD